MAARFKLDENLSRDAEATSRDFSFDAETALTEGLADAPDPDLLAACSSEKRILTTLDLDFANVRNYPPGSHRGIWTLRPAQQSVAAVSSLVSAGMRLLTIERTEAQH
jgi:predicted nuclease of predicted toxin-antitoxin system